MKRFMAIVGQAVVSLACGLLLAIVAGVVSTYWAAPIAAGFVGVLLGAMVTGVLDGAMPRHMSLKDAARDYGRAA